AAKICVDHHRATEAHLGCSAQGLTRVGFDRLTASTRALAARLPRSRIRFGALDDGQPAFLKPALDHRPVPPEAVLVHRVRAKNRRTVIPADYLRATGRAEERLADDADAGCANVEPAIREIARGLAFLEFTAFAMI